eukprot:6464341-Amphidinium_carterae.1
MTLPREPTRGKQILWRSQGQIAWRHGSSVDGCSAPQQSCVRLLRPPDSIVTWRSLRKEPPSTQMHFACRAEARCRTEWWLSERLKQETFHQSSPSFSAFLLAMPWESVTKTSASAQKYWSRELKDSACEWSCQ